MGFLRTFLVNNSNGSHNDNGAVVLPEKETPAHSVAEATENCFIKKFIAI